VIVEKKAMVGSVELPVGAYGFGLQKPASGDGPAKILLYDVAGQKLGETTAAHDAGVAQPAPLKVLVAKGQPTKLLLGKFGVEIK